MIPRLLTAPLLAGLVLVSACGAPKSEEAVQKIVRDYLVENPEVIIEALNAYDAKQAAEREKQLAAAVTEQADALYKNASDPSIGPADAKVTVVEFFDYRCGFCKKSTDWVFGLPKQYDNNVRVVFKELPIFGGISKTASLAALAAGKQGKYVDMHLALMTVDSNDDLTDETIDALARKAGVNVAKMRADMQSEAVQKQLAETMALGQALQVGGTPGFFIGDKHIEGADTQKVEAAIKAALGS